MKKQDNVKLTGLKGTWYSVGEKFINGELFTIWESEIWGDEAPHSITNEKGLVVFTEEHNWFEDYEYARFMSDDFTPYHIEYKNYLEKKEGNF